MRILLVEDDDRVASFLERGLRAEGYFIVRACDGKEGLELAQEGDFQLILLDIMLPSLNGLEVCQALRIKKNLVPIIMLTAMDESQDIIKGLRLGADDYVTKPFAYDELLARIEAVTRRTPNEIKNTNILEFGPLCFDRSSYIVSLDNEEISLTVKEMAILELLMTNTGKYLSRERILSNVWGMEMDPMTNVVDVYIGKLRKKLTIESKGESMIETKRGIGYRLNLVE
ncbi:response regulator transcription factor [Pseudoalteromonas tunicata]|jgi:DNA-binding response OmpR family regulator|uniref:Probable two-component response regulator transcription regulator protein n=1 Tax=Pseudoalteromonas tunicata D2 TaxID=87626 RepID=A4CE30_9GAMM|nr:response regulator transcription factor [Pseudoalteromonas tunicata]ATC96285.1 two-component system, OmpR family, copper resistance phosphate regulon response regulator CusR [Pseudoalteromonas tunicata]AXT31795.1 DNA-binding response regulator [Pseudoalteromonas tunicata]EAR27222.1 probable two-component response regulator transcription regulator protein [Pseudoalteromonas tunicata D2]MDP4982833.1 response regulator transcription factor [Pseudoalteromonas tunicata]MDP5212201.1 response regu